MSMSTAELLLEWDRRRPRSLQETIGMSEIGGCRRRAKYRLEFVEPTDDGASIQAALGTLIHEAVAKVLNEMQEAGVIPPEDLVEAAVTFDGVEGHLDHYEADTETLVDTKSINRWRLDRIKIQGLPLSWRYQTVDYAAGLIKQGHPVKWIRIDAIVRDSGEEWTDTRLFDVEELRAAKAWLDDVRATPLEQTERDYDPDSAWCEHCPFRSVCWDSPKPTKDSWRVLYAENPDAQHWSAELNQARLEESAAKRRAEKARGALLAIDPNDDRRSTVDIGLPDKLVTFTHVESERVDPDGVRELCAAAGVPIPMKTTQSVKVGFTKKPKES